MLDLFLGLSYNTRVIRELEMNQKDRAMRLRNNQKARKYRIAFLVLVVVGVGIWIYSSTPKCSGNLWDYQTNQPLACQ